MGRQAVRPAGLKTDYERAFIALVPDPASLSKLAAYSTSSLDSSLASSLDACSVSRSTVMADTAAPAARMKATPYDPADLHMTLAFLGGIDAAQVATILAELPHMAHPLPTLTCIGEAWWPNTQRPRVQVIRYGQPPALKTLFEAVQLLVMNLGLPIDSRPFRPHITLARVKAAVSDPTANATDRAELNARMESIGLFCKNTQGGPLRYRTLGRFPLGNALT